jgi:hypothetical protein
VRRASRASSMPRPYRDADLLCGSAGPGDLTARPFAVLIDSVENYDPTRRSPMCSRKAALRPECLTANHLER